MLELIPDQPEESDPAFIHAIGRDTVEALQHDGITVQPVYTGQQGGAFLVEIITVVSQLATAAWDHRTVIEEALNDSSALVTLSGLILTIIHRVTRAYERRVGHAESVAHPLKIIIALDEDSITIETSNLPQAQDMITKLVQQFQNIHSSTKVSSPNKLKIQPKIPKKRTRGKK